MGRTSHRDIQLSYIIFALCYTILTIKNAQSCSPPRSKYGEYSITQLSELGRSDKAEIIVLGTVVDMYPDKRVQSMMVRIAVHMLLKSKKRTKKYIKVSGFENSGKSNRNTLFVHQATTDCVATEVNLYGTYVFFLRSNKYNEYSVDEINFQPAVTEVACDVKLNKQLKRLIKKYRKTKKNKSQCNDFENGTVNTSRKCLKHRQFTKLVKAFQYNLLPVRQYYCNMRRKKMAERELKRKIRREKRRKQRVENTDPKMHDIIRNTGHRNVNKKTTRNKISNSNNFVHKETNINSVNHDTSSSSNFILSYSKSENYILHQNSHQHTHTHTDSKNRHIRVKLRNWRLFDSNNRSSASVVTPSFDNKHLILLSFALLTSLACLC